MAQTSHDVSLRLSVSRPEQQNHVGKKKAMAA